MFTILNRLRGTKQRLSYLTALLFSLLIFSLLKDYYVSLAVYAGYIIGESFGWGDWVGTLTTDRKYSTDNNKEGWNLGIPFIAGLFYDWKTEWRKYSFLALSIRGFIWWFLALIPLCFAGFNPLLLLVSIILLGVSFPITCLIAKRYPLHIKNKFYHADGAGETQEVYYGITQDIIIGGMLCLKLTGKM